MSTNTIKVGASVPNEKVAGGYHTTTATLKEYSPIFSCSEGESNNQLMLEAMDYAASDWPVFPLVPNTKRPATEHGLKDASTDPDTIREWWTRWPNANIGIALPPDLVAVDIDVKDVDGHATMAELAAQHGGLPETLTVETASGGWHLYFKKPPEVRVKNRAGIRPGIDVRAHGGYLVAPPSIIVGRSYKWIGQSRMVDCPQWLLDVLTEEKNAPASPATAPQALQSTARDHYSQRALERATSAVLAAPEGGRNDVLNGAAYGLSRLSAAGRLDWQQVAATMERAALAAGLEPDEVRKTLESARTAGQTSPNYEGLPDRPRQSAGFEPLEVDTDEPPGPKLSPVSVFDVVSAPSPAPSYVWKGYLPRGEVSLLGAHGGTGKSYISLMLAVAAATGRPLFGIDTEPSRVLFLSLEDSGPVVRHRLANICRQWDIEPEELANLQVFDGTDDPELFATAGRDAGTTTGTYAELRKLAAGADLVIVDNASDAYGGDEIQRRQVRAFIRCLKSIAKDNNSAVLLLAHVDKNTSRARKAEGGEGYSGSTAWHNSVRSRLFMTRDEQGGLKLEHQKINHGKLREPLHLFWPADGLPQLDAPLAGVVAHIADRVNTKALLKLIAEFTERGEHVSAATTSRTHAVKLLSGESTYPKGLKQNDVFDLLRQAERAGYLARVEYRGADRKQRERWEVTSQGREQAGLSPAATAATAATYEVLEVTAPAAVECGDCGDSARGYGGKSAHMESPQPAVAL